MSDSSRAADSTLENVSMTATLLSPMTNPAFAPLRVGALALSIAAQTFEPTPFNRNGGSAPLERLQAVAHRIRPTRPSCRNGRLAYRTGRERKKAWPLIMPLRRRRCQTCLQHPDF